ncbi:uncharacterized protein LOC130447029 isoform X2 [Diorhabda sublineata]|nr:uncharacterized protein LOC130447029 isoform X2 [Diorhabda sublineata]
MDKEQFLGNEIADLDSYVCVNPYDVNPLLDSTDLRSLTLRTDIPLKVESSATPPSQSAINGGMFYETQKRIKLEMEEFGDLSPFVSQRQIISNSVHELQTPIFDKSAFDYNSSIYQKNAQADLHVKLKYDALYLGNNRQGDMSHNSEITHRNIPTSNNNQQYYDTTIYSPTSENGTYIERKSSSATLFDFDMNDSVSVNSNGHSSYPSPTMDTNNLMTVETPNEIEESTSTSKPRLFLDIGLKQQSNVYDINTPSIIAEVVSLESTGFNILDLVNDDQLDLVNTDIFTTTTTTPSPTPMFITNQSECLPTLNRSTEKRPKKRRQLSDDDEDYVPPIKKTSKNVVRRRKTSYCTEVDSDEEEEEKPKRKARGRPPKRAESVSSESSKDTDISKYRELRDKNNEASRKSRLKRKMKETELETEANELHNRNIKLKAQVEELEKMVTNFRDNLFKIMINK